MGWVCVVLLTTMLAGVWRSLRGPSTTDRLIGLQMVGTTSVALLLVLAEWQQQPALQDLALLVALLAAAVVAALVQILRRQQSPMLPDNDQASADGGVGNAPAQERSR